jgi:hypothetical protein
VTDREALYITHPGVGRTFHVFRKSDDRSLCGRYGMLRRDPAQCYEITDDTIWQKGQDCKPCFRAAGLLREEAR